MREKEPSSIGRIGSLRDHPTEKQTKNVRYKLSKLLYKTTDHVLFLLLLILFLLLVRWLLLRQEECLRLLLLHRALAVLSLCNQTQVPGGNLQHQLGLAQFLQRVLKLLMLKERELHEHKNV